MNLSEREDFARSMAFKSIMTVGDSQVDVKSSIGWSYSSNPDGYLFVDFVYPTGTVVRAKLDDRNDFYRFLLQIELFIDNTEVSMPNINKFIKKIEQPARKLVIVQRFHYAVRFRKPVPARAEYARMANGRLIRKERTRIGQ